jgi:hypothetical protein
MARTQGKRERAARISGAKSINKKTNANAHKNSAGSDARELTSQHGPDAIAELARLSTSATPDSTRLSAIGMLLDRAYGKPKQALEHSGEDGGPIQVTIVGDDSRLL